MRYDDNTFAYKFLTRFGAVTVASTLAFAVCYPLDTIKRRMQAEGSPGYKFTNTHNELVYAKDMLAKEGVRSFYGGFTVGLARTIPLCFIQFVAFQNLKGQ